MGKVAHSAGVKRNTRRVLDEVFGNPCTPQQSASQTASPQGEAFAMSYLPPIGHYYFALTR